MFDRLIYGFLKCQYIIRNIIGKIAVLAVIPNLLDRIKIGGISWKPFNLNTFGKPLSQSSFCPAMNQPAVENQDNTMTILQQLHRTDSALLELFLCTCWSHV